MKNFAVSSAITCYSILLETARKCVLPFLSTMGQRRGWNLAERQRVPVTVRDYRNRTVAWVHAASLGEAKLLMKFLEILDQRHPDDLYLVTATTRTGVEYLHANKTPSVCAIGFLPLDTLGLMRQILDRFKVTRLWLMETEVWPGMLWSCFTKNIPVGIVNGRLEEKSFKSYGRFKGIIRAIFSGFDIVLAQNDTYAERFRAMGVRPGALHVTGNIKGHVVIRRPHREEWLASRKAMNIPETAFVLTAGCLHPGEGAAIRQCALELDTMGYACKCIVVPRHIEEAPQLLDELGGATLVLEETRTTRKWETCIVSKMGILDEMYKISDIAFVGGTFVEVGGHNVWDPARFGIPVFFGPDYHTQTEGCEKLMTAGVGFRTGSGTELAEQIVKVMKKEPRKFINAEILFMETVNKGQSVIESLLP